MPDWAPIGKLAPALAPAVLYSGFVWHIFKVMDERFPALRIAVLDWITRKDRRLDFGNVLSDH